MKRIYDSVAELAGKTPLLRLHRFEEKRHLGARLLAKLEYLNPAGSAKDRVALAMIDDAEEKGLLKPDGTVIEPTSGNTGIGLCAAAAARGYRAIIVMPDTMSAERQMLMRAYGAKLVLTPGALGMKGAIEKAEELNREIEGSIVAGQFANPANPKAHFETTGPEIWEDTGGEVDVFVAGIGTGGTVTGVGRFLKRKNQAIKIVGVEPEDSPLLTKGVSGAHGLQGIGANFVPEILDRGVIDEILTVSTEDAYAVGREIPQTEGFLIGISSGAALFAAAQLAKRPEYAGKNIVVLLPDGGERYLSTALYRE